MIFESRGSIQEQKYTLPAENIVSLGEDSEIRQRNEDFFLGLKDEGIDWPIEIQGSGHSDFTNKEFKIYYPHGDLFLSTAVTIHELGHLRQGEIDGRFADEVLGAPATAVMGELEFHSETEMDAWQRGLDRTKRYCPEFLQQLETKFAQYKKQEKFKDFANFESFLNYVIEIGLTITAFSDRIKEKEDNRQIGRQLGQDIQTNDLTREFFTRPEKWRSGESIDQQQIESFIRQMAEKIAEEKY